MDSPLVPSLVLMGKKKSNKCCSGPESPIRKLFMQRHTEMSTKKHKNLEIGIKDNLKIIIKALSRQQLALFFYNWLFTSRDAFYSFTCFWAFTISWPDNNWPFSSIKKDIVSNSHAKLLCDLISNITNHLLHNLSACFNRGFAMIEDSRIGEEYLYLAPARKPSRITGAIK